MNGRARLSSGLYAIADASVLASRNVELRAFAEDLRAAGVGVVQWRAKDLSPAQVLAGAAVLRHIFAGTDTLLVMNDRVDLCLLAGFGGVHLGQEDMAVEDARRLLGADAVIGISTHTPGEVRDAPSADYIAVGPVFGTSTKLDAAPVVGLDGVRRARAFTSKPLVAIGGITLENVVSVQQAGADMAAVISGLLLPGRSVEKVAREFQSAFMRDSRGNLR